MPYYLFRVHPFARFEKLSEHTAFKEASAHAKALRASDIGPAAGKIKLMFADNPGLAEDLLCQVRDPGPSGDD